MSSDDVRVRNGSSYRRAIRHHCAVIALGVSLRNMQPQNGGSKNTGMGCYTVLRLIVPRLECAHVVMLAFEMVELIEPGPNLNDCQRDTDLDETYI